MGKLSPMMLERLMIRGGGIHIDDALRRFGWEGEGPVGITIMTTDADTGMVAGVRLETRGVGPMVTFKARDLWAGAEAAASVTLKFGDLAVAKWKTEGGGRNQCSWIDSADLEVSYKMSEGRMLETVGELEGANTGKFCVRLTLLPIAVDRLALYGGIVPLAKEDLEDKVVEAGLDMLSPMIPTVALKLRVTCNKPQNSYPVAFLPTEGANDRVGLGHFPLVETVGSTKPKLPETDDLEEQLCSFLRDVTPTNNMVPYHLAKMLTPGNFPSHLNGKILYSWPEYRGPLGGQQSQTRNLTGM